MSDISRRRFEGKVALVTGGSSGIGRHTAKAFAREGASVVVSGRNQEELALTVEQIENGSGVASAAVADLTNSDELAALVRTVVERHGALDIAVNNAGVFAAGPLHEFEDDELERLVAINVTGAYLSMKHEIAHMRKRGGGTIINVASNLGAHTVVPYLTAYVASKAAVSAMTRAAAREYVGEGIRINAVSPGMMDTSMSLAPGEADAGRAERAAATVPLGRVGSLDEVAGAILFLASAESSYAVGHDLVLDGGVSA